MLIGFFVNDVKPGDKHRGVLTVSGAPDIPLWVVAGAAPDPTLAVSAGVHGCEYVGIFVARDLYEEIYPAALRGSSTPHPTFSAWPPVTCWCISSA